MATRIDRSAMDRNNLVVRAVLERRSTRSFVQSETLDPDLLALIVRCGLAAPSSKNARPWRFHVVTDPQTLRQLAATVEAAVGSDEYVPHDPRTGRPRPEYHSTVAESAEVLRTCAAGIFVENRGVFSRGRRTLIEVSREALAASMVGYGLEVLGVGAAIENMLLAAQSLGLGATFMGDVLIGEQRISESLLVVGDLMGVVVLGYPAEQPPTRPEQSDPFDPAGVVWH